MSSVIRAVYEKGVLKPLERVRLGERQVCLVSIYPEDQWREAFDALLKRTHKRTRRATSQEIEADITAARSEVRAKRHATRRTV
jgi:predicted DNA-binding antitoxin AbrB/MazE fold protein